LKPKLNLIRKEVKKMKFTKPFLRIILSSLVVSVFLLFLVCGEEKPVNPYNAELTFEQMDFDLDGEITENSSWGYVTLTFDGSPDVIYFNLVVDSRWVIQNIPVLSTEGEGIKQAQTVAFDLGVADGTKVSEIEYSFTLNNDIIDEKPDYTQTSPVTDGLIVFYSGFTGEVYETKKPPPPPPELSCDKHRVKDWAMHKDKFPNQECGEKECVPAAVSNSLKFLNSKYNLGLTDEQTGIGKMKDATGWSSGYGCDKDNWWTQKNEYMMNNHYPITTTQTNKFDDVLQAIKDGKDVELSYDSHCVAVVGIAKIEDGNYILLIAHDKAQNDDSEKGRAKPEIIKYDSTTKTFSGTDWAGKSFNYFVIEAKSS